MNARDAWVLTLTTGEYSDTCVTFLRVFDSEADAEAARTRCVEAHAAIRAAHADAIDECRWRFSDDMTPAERASLLLDPEVYASGLDYDAEARFDLHRVPRGGAA